MAQVFHTFKEFAAARGIKPKTTKTEVEYKCPKCGDAMRNVAGTNVYMCDHVDLADAELKGKPVQVFTKCKTVVYA